MNKYERAATPICSASYTDFDPSGLSNVGSGNLRANLTRYAWFVNDGVDRCVYKHDPRPTAHDTRPTTHVTRPTTTGPRPTALGTRPISP